MKYPSLCRTTFALVLLTAAACTASQGVDPDERLVQLVDQYRLPQTLHCKVTMSQDYKTIPPGIFHVDGTQEYWADGDKYRILQIKNTPMLPDMSHDVRWDGQRFQWFNLADSTLVVSRKVEQKTPYIAEPIPLLPVAFLNPAGDDLGVKLSLTEVRSDQTLGRLPTAHFVVGNGGEVEFPGGAIGKTEFTYRIDFGTSPSYLPTKISRISSDGVELTTTELSYQPVQCASGTVYLPRWARMTNRTTDNRVFMVTTCTVTSIDADTIVAPETFTLNFQTAKTVLDMDRPRHLAIGGTNPNDGARFADQAASQTAPKDAALSVETALLTPAAKTDGDNDQWPVVNMALLLIGLIALSAGSATIFRKRRLSGGPQ